jgi:hypothetical protein
VGLNIASTYFACTEALLTAGSRLIALGRVRCGLADDKGWGLTLTFLCLPIGNC